MLEDKKNDTSMAIPVESISYKDGMQSSPGEDSKPLVDDDLLGLLHVDFTRAEDPKEEKEKTFPVPDQEFKNGTIDAPQNVKPSGKSYECPDCDFIATGSDNMKLYEEAVKHKKSSHKDVPKLIAKKNDNERGMKFQCILCPYSS